jgi:hypothetical protein
MDTCVARRGFLTLRDCGQPSGQLCITCQRPMCTEHLSSASGFQECLDCFARSEQSKDIDATDTAYAYRYRNDYYASSHYAPVYFGSYSDSYYDDLDVRSFDDNVNAGALDDDDGGERAGFGDS